MGRLGIIVKVTLSMVPNIQVRRTLDQMSTQDFIDQIKGTQAAYVQALASASPEAVADALAEIDETQVGKLSGGPSGGIMVLSRASRRFCAFDQTHKTAVKL